MMALSLDTTHNGDTDKGMQLAGVQQHLIGQFHTPREKRPSTRDDEL